ncbi:ABC transporter permease subunit [Mesorhizobium sp. B2-3-5]|uniref:ABC transporter permease n=1 Tax=Mesorhizobium sp. B2-3-5 TaxID=2589958 RepID=UPI001128E838|nr:ABC transporter permease subunit [Mesorhizobium sp. B2-3-5]TPM24063.1 ABC transporter permease subunit [Mesorhizobium sp. B2-3-5]
MSAQQAVFAPNESVPIKSRQLLWLVVLAFIAICIAMRPALPWLVTYPSSWLLPVPSIINSVFGFLIPLLTPICAVLAIILRAALDACSAALQWMPWPAMILFFAILGWLARGWQLALFTAVGLGYVVMAGYWEQGMNTLSLVTLAVPLAVGFGFLLGVAAHSSRYVRGITMVVLDLLQTVPAFAFLIPLLLLFGFGPIVGLIACLVYAVAPMVHCTMLGLERVPPSLLEAASMAGCTRRQRFWHVILPTAKREILTGINQTTMAAFSMVIMAAIIGGFNDVGWEVLNSMRKAEFGQSLLSGLVIAVLAMVVDRITFGMAQPARDRTQTTLRNGLRMAVILALPLFVAFLLNASPSTMAWADKAQGVIDPSGLNRVVIRFVQDFSAPLDAFKVFVLYHFMLPLRIGLVGAVTPFTWGFAWTFQVSTIYCGLSLSLAVWLWFRGQWQVGAGVLIGSTLLLLGFDGFPWPAFVIVVTALAWSVSGARLASLAGLGTCFIVGAGLYGPLGQSLYLCLLAVLICMFVGGLLGVAAAKSDRFSAVLKPVCDALQTMPQFIFLIPALMFFQVGELTGLIAIALYAIVPPIRYVEYGIRSVPADLVETSRQIGCTAWQRLIHVELPVAKPVVVLGANQTIMAALSMLPVAALVGTKDLGQQVYIALSKADAGLGLVAGLSVALVAMISDRIMRATVSNTGGALD